MGPDLHARADPARHVDRFCEHYCGDSDEYRTPGNRTGRRIAFRDQPFRVLLRLLQQPVRRVTRKELRRDLWISPCLALAVQSLCAMEEVHGNSH